MEFTCKANSNIDVSSVTYYANEDEGSKTNTAVSFDSGANNKTFTLEDGKLNGVAFAGYKANVTPTEAVGEITYDSSNKTVATVAADGALTFVGYGTTTITASFTPNDANAYAASSAYYTIINKEKVDDNTIVFDVTSDKTSTKSGKADDISKSIVKIHSDKAAFGCYNDYRFYKNASTTFSLTDPNRVITSIKFEGGTKYDKFSATTGDYSNGVWTGSDETVTFKHDNSATIDGVKKITVTTSEKKPSPALSFAEATQCKVYDFADNSNNIYEVQTLSKPSDLNADAITYSLKDGSDISKDCDKAVAEYSDGCIYVYKPCEVYVVATSAATDLYAAGEAFYKLVVADNRADAGVSVKEDAVTVDITKEDYDANSNITNTNGIALKFKSENENVAGVSDDGKTVLLYKEGSALISVSYIGDNTYKPVDLQFTLNVADTRTTDSEFKFDKDEYELDLNGQSTVDFNCSEYLKNPNTLTVKYSCSGDEENIQVDDKTGYVVVGARGTYTIKAVGSGDKYKETTATCTLKVTDSTIADMPIEFVAGTDKGSTTGMEADEMSKSVVTIKSTSAAFAVDGQYKFYGSNTTHTFSTRVGNIVSIEFVGTAESNPLTNFTYKGEDGKFVEQQKLYAKWAGKAKSVEFSTTAQTRATNIIVTVEAPKAVSYEYSENSDNTITTSGNATITLNRSLVAGKWNTLCLPFDMDAAMIKDVFGDIQVAGLDESTTETGLISFKKTTAIKAATPYLVKPTEGKDKYVFENVEVTETSPYYSVNGSQIAFVGVYNPTDITSDVKKLDTNDGDYYAAFLGSEGMLYKAEGGSDENMKGFRAYFAIPSSLEVANVSVGGVVTSIKSIEGADADDADAPVYNLQGQRVDGKQLQRGIYVKNGRKFIVK